MRFHQIIKIVFLLNPIFYLIYIIIQLLLPYLYYKIDFDKSVISKKKKTIFRNNSLSFCII